MNKKYYFIAIGGIGMSGLAKYLLEQGYEVSGSDICESKYTEKLKNLGAEIFIGHKAENLPDDCIVVTSTAIKDSNPELKKAKELGLTIYHRSDLLAEISGDFQSKSFPSSLLPSIPMFVGYAGTHGKTTTSGFVSYVLEKAGLEPSFVVGGFVPEINTNAQFANGKYFIAELDESDGTIVKYSPDITVINNIEADHLDFYIDGLDSIMETFVTFLKGLSDRAVVLANNDCQNVVKLMELYPNRNYITYGLSNADYTAKNIEYNVDNTTFDIYFKGEYLTDLKIILKGVHNVYNALAVFASLKEAGVNIEDIKEHFSTFTGMGRRFEKVAEFDGITVYDDYAHHPTEIKATLSSAESFKNNRVVAVFQPHRYTRLKNLWNEFIEAFDSADRVVVTDVYSASEDPIEGISPETFVKELSNRLNIPIEHISGDMKEFAQKLLPTLKQNDIVIGMGAGTITYLGKELLEAQKKEINIAN